MTNERIRELSKQAGQGDMFSVPPKFIDSFARLIVAECALLCVSRPGPDDDLRSREHCAEQIKEHFGIEDKNP